MNQIFFEFFSSAVHMFSEFLGKAEEKIYSYKSSLQMIFYLFIYK